VSFVKDGTPVCLEAVLIPNSIYRRVIQAAVGLLGFIFCLFCLWTAARTGLSRLYSTYAADTGRIEGADAALELAPSDPEAHLIRAALLKADNRLYEAIREYEKAAALRPRDYVLWLELGLARDEAQDRAGAINAFQEAVELAPYYADPRWQLGNVLLRAGRMDEAFALMRRAAESSHALLPQLIDLAWNIYNGDVALVEQAVQPQTSADRLALARFAAKHGKAEDAARIFRTIKNVSEEDRRALLTGLVAAKEFKVAYEVWSSEPSRAKTHSDSGFTDGGFEEKINLDEPGFGWQIARNLQTVRASLDQAQPHSGSGSLRLDWSGDSSPTTQIISQTVLVEPNARYRLRFAVRTEELVTGGLPVVAILDASAKDSTQLAQSDPLPPKTAPWQEGIVEFATGKETRAVLVILRRQSCTGNPCPIFGRVWLDDFSLQKL
jgi:tetratricopeptide (TPR) repeat protein